MVAPIPLRCSGRENKSARPVIRHALLSKVPLKACAALLAAPACFAQTQPVASASNIADTQLAEIVVTAQFRQQIAQDTPVTLTAVDAKTLEARGQVVLNEVAAQAPNVTLEPAPGNFGPALQAF